MTPDIRNADFYIALINYISVMLMFVGLTVSIKSALKQMKSFNKKHQHKKKNYSRSRKLKNGKTNDSSLLVSPHQNFSTNS